MAVDMFLQIDKLTGESEDASHKGEIEILGWAWAATQTGTSGSGTGLGTGKVEHQDLVIRKRVDRASPVLYRNCAKGEHIASAKLTVRKAGGDALEYLIIHLEHLMITSFELNGEPGQEQISETLRINFTKACISYTPQVEGGGGSGAVTAGWDLKGSTDFVK